MPFGIWLMVIVGTLGQRIMPAVMCGARLLKNRDPFGASIGVWMFGVSVVPDNSMSCGFRVSYLYV